MDLYAVTYIKTQFIFAESDDDAIKCFHSKNNSEIVNFQKVQKEVEDIVIEQNHLKPPREKTEWEKNREKQICRDCCHWIKGRCQKTKYNTDMLTGKGKWLGIKTSWNKRCYSDDFVKKENK